MNGIPVAVLISGGGTTLRNLIAWRDAGKLVAELRLVISSSPSAGGLEIARGAGIETLVLDHRKFSRPDQISRPLFEACRERQIGHLVCGGFLRKLLIPHDFEHRILNIHPSLIPAFCGKGMYGSRVHRAVLDAGVWETGCTVHLVDNHYDHGPILHQRPVLVLDGDTETSLAARVFAAECELYPEAINQFLSQSAGRQIDRQLPDQFTGRPNGAS